MRRILSCFFILIIISVFSLSVLAVETEEYFLNVGNSVDLKGDGVIKVRLNGVGMDGVVLVEVNGLIDYIPTSSTKIVNGVEIRNQETFYDSNDVSQRSATLLMLAGGEILLGTVGEYFLNVGDSITVDGKIVTLINVDEGGSVYIEVDEVKETIPSSSAKVVNGIEIRNQETFYDSNDASQRSATLIVYGSKIGGVIEGVPPAPSISDILAVVGDIAPASDTLAAVDISAYIIEKYGVMIQSKLDKEVVYEDMVSRSMIVIGNLCTNDVFKTMIGRVGDENDPAYCVALFSDGEGWILFSKTNDGKGQIHVGGCTAIDTRRAAKLLAEGGYFSVSGNNIILGDYKFIRVGGTLENPVVLPSNAPKKPCPVSEVIPPGEGICNENGICEPEYGEDKRTCYNDCGGDEEILIECDEFCGSISCTSGFTRSNCGNINYETKEFECRVPKEDLCCKGDRRSGLYCYPDDSWNIYKESGEPCTQNYECSGNLCVDDKCVSKGLLIKIFDWFARVFGYVVKT